METRRRRNAGEARRHINGGFYAGGRGLGTRGRMIRTTAEAECREQDRQDKEAKNTDNKDRRAGRQGKGRRKVGKYRGRGKQERRVSKQEDKTEG